MGIDVVMFLYPAKPVTADEVKRAAVRMQISLGENGIGWLQLPNEHTPGCHSLMIGEKKGKPCVGVHTLARYYGPSYSRGPAVKILNTIRFLRDAFPGCELHYGGDCDDDVPVFTLDDEAEMWRQVTSEDGYAYYSASPMRAEGSVICDFCEVRTNAFSWAGGGAITSSCPSCHRQWKMQHGVATLITEK